MQTISSRSFNQDTSRAKKAAEDGPVVITDRGKPVHVLLTHEAYQKLAGCGPTIGDLMFMPGVADIDLDIPSRAGDFSRDVDFS